MCLDYGDWLRVWYAENWKDFIAMAWFFSLFNCGIKLIYMILLMVLTVKEHNQI